MSAVLPTTAVCAWLLLVSVKSQMPSHNSVTAWLQESGFLQSSCISTASFPSGYKDYFVAYTIFIDAK